MDPFWIKEQEENDKQEKRLMIFWNVFTIFSVFLFVVLIICALYQKIEDDCILICERKNGCYKICLDQQ